MRRAWSNKAEATEWAAHCIAILLIEELTGYTALERERRKLGFNYWLGNTTTNLISMHRKAGLVVSGLRRAGTGQVVARARHELELESKVLVDGDYPIYVVVVEFSKPSMFISLSPNRKLKSP